MCKFFTGLYQQKIKIILLMLIFYWVACANQTMKLEILETIKLNNLPSGSGITKVNKHYFAIGDDTPFLFKMNENFEVEDKIELQNVTDFSGNRIAKSKKPDFEALEIISENEMVIFGSGSKSPERDVFINIFIEDSVKVEYFQITQFYDKLKSLLVFVDSELNIEAVAFKNGRLFLFNRRKNVILNFDYHALKSHLKGSGDFPHPEITVFNLPKIKGIESGFTGASAFVKQSKLVFTAAVEDTNNAYNDGEILGSFVGSIDLINEQVSSNLKYCLIPSTTEFFKVESVTITAELSTSRIKALLITDDDKGSSVLLNGILTW